MQLLLTDVEHASFPRIMRTNVLDPLGMTSSTFENPLPQKYHAIAATGYRADLKEVEGKWPIYPEMAAAGLWTPPSQLIRYAIEIQRIRKSQTDGVLTADAVEQMLTPGMRGHGLGPRSTRHWFGHPGADEGFTANLVAWTNLANAVVVMVNSDNGKIISEVVRAVADEYDLPAFKSEVRSTIKLPETERARFTGTYVREDAKVEVVLQGQGLGLKFERFSAFQLPESKDQFFDPDTGTTIRFREETNSVTGFEIVGGDTKWKKIK